VEKEVKGGKRKKKSRRDGKVDQKNQTVGIWGWGVAPPSRNFLG
jgi:hypothetical protein